MWNRALQIDGAGFTTAFAVRAEAIAGQDLCLIPRTFVEWLHETCFQQVSQGLVSSLFLSGETQARPARTESEGESTGMLTDPSAPPLLPASPCTGG